MAIKDLIPWNNRGREVGFQRGTDVHPFFALHREMNRMFDDVFRGFDLAPFGPSSRAQDGLGWPQIDIDETDKEVRITAELPGLDEKDVSLEIANGVLSISGEKKTESEDKARPFQRAILRPLRTTHTAAGHRGGQGLGRVQERRTDRHGAESGRSEKQCPPHRDQPQWLTHSVQPLRNTACRGRNYHGAKRSSQEDTVRH
jgi:HSP20 family molecular chaperone IbpA